MGESIAFVQAQTPTRSASPLFLTVAMATGLVALFVVSRKWQSSVVADRWESQLAQADESQIKSLVQQISALDQVGLPGLVRATGSQRQLVADSARQEIAALLQRWEMLESWESGPRLATLADNLAREVESFPRPARDHAVALAERILLWPTDGTSVDRTKLVACCERVFRIAGASRKRPTVGNSIERAGQTPVVAPRVDPLARQTPVLDPVEAGNQLQGQRHPVAFHRPVTTSVDIVRLASLPGGGLPVEPIGVGKLPVLRDTQGDPLPTSPVRPPRLKDEPHRLYDNPASDPARTATPWPVPRAPNPRTAIEALKDTPLYEGDPNNDNPAADRPTVPNRLPATNDVPTPGADSNHQDDHVKQVGAVRQETLHTPARELRLIRALNSDDSQSVSIATRELRTLGFSDTSLRAARDLTHRDPDVRQRLARSVPKMSGVNSRHWLLWLSEDKDPDVRLTAISLLLTTGDRLLTQRVAEKSANDSDPRIRKQIARALEAQQP